MLKRIAIAIPLSALLTAIFVGTWNLSCFLSDHYLKPWFISMFFVAAVYCVWIGYLIGRGKWRKRDVQKC